MDPSVQQALNDRVIEYNKEHARFKCLYCNVSLSGEASAKDHLVSKQHRETGAKYAIQNLRSSPRSIMALLPELVKEAARAGEITMMDSRYVCCLCNMPSNGIVSLNDHLTSKNHGKKKEAKITTDSPVVGASSIQSTIISVPAIQRAVDDRIAECRNLNDFYCKICEMSSNSEVSFEQHLDSKKHSEAGARRVFENFETSPRSLIKKLPDVVKDAAKNRLVTVTDSKNFFCNICKAPSNGVQSLKEHLLGDDHRRRSQTYRDFDVPVPSSTCKNDRALDFSEIRKAINEKIVSELDDRIDKFCCNLCSKKFSSAGPLIDHLKSKKHIQKEKLYMDSRGATPVPVPRNYAEAPVSSVQRTPSSTRRYSILSGCVYIFNNSFKGKERPRNGAEHDSRNLRVTFERMGYKVFLLEDLTGEEMRDCLKRIQKDSVLNEIDAFIVFFLSHGKDAYTFFANDYEEMDLFSIRRMFTDRKCPYLRGKPKIFFVNYCRGSNMQRKDLEFDDIEAPCDIATIHAATEGIQARRDRDIGTIFVASLCELLRRHSKDLELRDIYLELEEEMKAKHGTRPMWEDYVFKHFYFQSNSS